MVEAASDRVLARWSADRRTYIRDHMLMAAIGGAGATGILWVLGNTDAWVGFLAAFLAIGVRGWYLASEELALEWVLTPEAVTGSNGKSVALRDIETVRTLGSAVQLVTRSGDKHLMKYLADPADIRARVEAEIAGDHR